jgi:hypothetical protein
VTLTREYGNLGMAQTLKHLRDSAGSIQFPQYEHGFANGEGFKRLGPLQLHRDLNKATT